MTSWVVTCSLFLSTYIMPMCTLNLCNLRFLSFFAFFMFFLWFCDFEIWFAHYLLVAIVSCDLFVSIHKPNVLFYFYDFVRKCWCLNHNTTSSSSIFIVCKTLAMTLHWLHVMCLPIATIKLNLCVSLPPWKVKNLPLKYL